MKYKFVQEFPNDFFSDKGGPLISIYQKTSRTQSENEKDALVFRGLIEEVESSLLLKYDKKKITPVMNMLKSIQKDSLFWTNILDGLALFATLDECIIYNLKSSLKTFAVVADSFHIKPLIKYYQLATNYQILDLSKQSFKILEGNIYDLSLKELDEDILTTQDEILGTETTEPYFTATSGTFKGGSGRGGFHGHGGKKDTVDTDLERFFRRVDEIVYEEISKKSKLPILLLAPKIYHSQFLNSSRNTYLKKKPITGSYADLGIRKVKSELNKYVNDTFKEEIKKLLKQYENLRPQELASEQLIEIVRAAISGRVQTLFVEENKVIPGKIDLVNKKIISKDLSDPEYNDILDELVKLTLEKSGQVFILSKEKMPTDSGAAAIYRY